MDEMIARRALAGSTELKCTYPRGGGCPPKCFYFRKQEFLTGYKGKSEKRALVWRETISAIPPESRPNVQEAARVFQYVTGQRSGRCGRAVVNNHAGRTILKV